jgi:phage terminase small subunit
VSADGLTDRERAFCLRYVANGFKGTAAYRSVAPHATEATCRSEAARWMTKPHIRRFLDAQLSLYFSRLEMAGAEALGRVAQDAKADIRELFDEHGKPLPAHLWPDSIANSIEACEVRADGSVRVKLVSKLAARRLILEATGTLQDSTRDGVSALARAIRGDLGLPDPGTDRAAS